MRYRKSPSSGGPGTAVTWAVLALCWPRGCTQPQCTSHGIFLLLQIDQNCFKGKANSFAVETDFETVTVPSWSLHISVPLCWWRDANEQSCLLIELPYPGPIWISLKQRFLLNFQDNVENCNIFLAPKGCDGDFPADLRRSSPLIDVVSFNMQWDGDLQPLMSRSHYRSLSAWPLAAILKPNQEKMSHLILDYT